MNYIDHLGILPEQYIGEEIVAEASTETKNETAAKALYLNAKQRLLNINGWHQTAGILSAGFEIVNTKGEALKRSVEQGDYLKIDIPGPGSANGDGFDWVYVEALKDSVRDGGESIGIRVRPSKNPLNEKSEVAHFYDPESTSTFIVSREDTTVRAIIIDSNITPNNEITSIADKIRNVAVAINAIGFFSKIQWQKLANGLISQHP